MDSQPLFSRVDSDPPNNKNANNSNSPKNVEAYQKPGSGNSLKSTNPFRKHEAATGLDASQFPSPEPYHPIGTRKNTPVRAVFHDLTTAHSSITSGTARSRQRTLSNNNSDAPDEGNSIPLQELELSKRDEGSSILQDLPLPPLPAILSKTRYERKQDLLTDHDEVFAGQNANLAIPIQPSLPEPKQSVFASIKNALASISSPSETHWPRERQTSALVQDPTSLEDDKNHEFDYVDDCSNYHSSAGPVQYPPSTPRGIRNTSLRTTGNGYPMNYHRPNLPASSPPLPMNTYPRKFSRFANGSDEISLREGSTVGNIVQHYAGSEGLDGDGSDLEQGPGARDPKAHSRNLFKPRNLGHDLVSSSPLYEPLQPSGLQIRKQRQGDKLMVVHSQTPRFDFAKDGLISGPAISSQNGRYNSSSVENPLGASNTNEGPQTPRRNAVRNPDSNEFFDESISDAANSTLPSLPRISYRNPFRPNQARGVQAHADPDHCVYDDDPNQELTSEPRMPLEREVSQALRRASGYSVYSVGSASSSVLDYGAILNYGNDAGIQSNTIGLLKGMEKEKVSGEANNNGGVHIADEQAKGFYDEDAIPTNWINSRQGIRVPINHNGSYPDSPPESLIDEHPKQLCQRRSTPADDNNDWETVGESGFGLDYAYGNDSGLIGGTVRRTGSSIANTSDEGTASIHFTDLDEFGSTERIAQHPGTIQYSGDYRQRDLKMTKMPILMPVFNGHKVNGYLADSNRIRPPPNPVFFRPAPLTEAHKHPFNSTPPEVMPPARVAKPRSIMRSHLAPTNSKAASSSQSGTQRDKDDTYRKPSFTGQSSRRACEWTDSYRQTGSSVSTQSHPFSEDDKHHPSSWQHVMAFANGGNVPGFRRDGSRICNPHSLKDEISLRDMLDDEQQNDKLTRPVGKQKGNGQIRIVPSLSRQPPGAFYQGLRAVSDQKRLNVPSQHDGAGKSTSRRSTVKAYGTTSLRPLSLVNDRLPSTPLRNVSNNSDVFDSDDFVYRSPLAPPKRSTWQKLYSNSRLFELQQRAKADGLYSSKSTLSNANEGLSRRHLYEPPKLAAKPSKVNHDPNLRDWKTKVSVIVLVLCCFFPPLLILYAIGKMDGIMIWWSNGEFSGFGKAQKKWAGILLCTEVFIIGILLIAFLAWFFSKRHG
ncbi:hypothetical protein ACEPPN_017506 [Leptodophora sp. 'Broadleaf-Isolate-01']